ncbi:MAG: SDR family oxidoreductase [Chloroflexota bacterium]|nr:SDR family oxidoreductase [Chloroflexota bacterium]
MMPDFNGKVAIITGAGGAIGSATARLLVENGAHVALLDLPTSKVQEVATQLGDAARLIPVDVKDEQSIREAVARTTDELGRPTLLVTVAAINLTGAVDTLPVEDWDMMMAVNVRGVFLPIKHTVPHMKALGGGTIVNMCSVSAFVGSTGGAPYHTTKGAVLSMTRSLAQELAPHNIRINAVCPGWVDTPFTDAYINAQPDPSALRGYANGLHALNRMARSDEVAEAVCWLLSERASFTTGSEVFVDGGYMVKR